MYEGGVYMRQGKSYLVRRLNLSSKIALCKEAKLDYYTKPRDCTDISVIGGNFVCQADNAYSHFLLGPSCDALEMQDALCFL